MPKVFEGVEAEGQFRGLWTLFVAGDVPKYVIDQYCREFQHAQVYFGAGNQSKVNWLTVENVANDLKYAKHIITAETVDIVPGEMFIKHRHVHLVVPLWLFGAAHTLDMYYEAHYSRLHRIQVKFDTPSRTYMCRMDKLDRNLRSDINGDKTLWEGD